MGADGEPRNARRRRPARRASFARSTPRCSSPRRTRRPSRGGGQRRADHLRRHRLKPPRANAACEPPLPASLPARNARRWPASSIVSDRLGILWSRAQEALSRPTRSPALRQQAPSQRTVWRGRPRPPAQAPRCSRLSLVAVVEGDRRRAGRHLAARICGERHDLPVVFRTSSWRRKFSGETHTPERVGLALDDAVVEQDHRTLALPAATPRAARLRRRHASRGRAFLGSPAGDRRERAGRPGARRRSPRLGPRAPSQGASPRASATGTPVRW